MTQTKERKSFLHMQEIAYGKHDLDDCTHVAEPNTFKPSPTEQPQLYLTEDLIAEDYETGGRLLGQRWIKYEHHEQIIAKLKQELADYKAKVQERINETKKYMNKIQSKEIRACVWLVISSFEELLSAGEKKE